MIHMEIVNHDEVFSRLSTEPIIVNHIDVTGIEEKEKLNRLIYTQYEGDSLDVLPSCDCGSLKGEYNVGVKCNNCQTTCESITERPLESLLWIERPAGVAGLINPTVWVILSKALTVSGCNMLEWLCNPMYKPPGTIPHQLLKLQQMNLPRGLNNFHDHFDGIMEALFQNNIVKVDKRAKQDLWQFIQMNRTKIFSRYLPIPSRIGFIMESTAIGVYADTTMTLAIDALRTISSIESSVTPLSQRGREMRVVKAITQLAEFYTKFAEETLSGKPGIFRKHVYGGRPHFSGRAVISSLSESHDYEELHLPWSLSVQLFKVHLTNKLIVRGFTPIAIERLFNEYTLNYHPLLDELFNELIKESPYKGIPVILQRNPTLARASAQRFYVTKIKTDPAINTISMSVLTLAGPNADFDGDELNLMLILDDEMHTRLSRLAPHLSALDLRSPRRISGNLKIPSPSLVTTSNWMYNGQ